MDFREARKEAEVTMRFNLGSLLWVDEWKVDDIRREYVFFLGYRKVSPATEESPLQYYDSHQIGEIRVTADGSVEYTDVDTITDRIEEIKSEASEDDIEYVFR